MIKTSNTVSVEQEMYKFLFDQSPVNLADIPALGKYGAQAGRYYVDVMAVRDVEGGKQWSEVLAFAREFLRRVSEDALIFSVPELAFVVYMLPAGPKAPDLEPFQVSLKHYFRLAASFGRGRSYPLNTIRKSCNEARLALHYPQIMGIKADIQHFSYMGIFTALFSGDLENAIAFCRNVMKPLLDYDAKNRAELLKTLTELVNSDFNLKETANNLFIHINTLYYRIKKIEQILEVDLSLMLTRSNLFTVLKSYALLRRSGLWS